MPEMAFSSSNAYLGESSCMRRLTRSRATCCCVEWELFFESLSLSLSVWKRFCLPLQVLFAGINKCFRSWRDDWNRFSRRPALMCALWAAWLRQRVACVWSEISSILFYCTNGLINTHRETTGWERLVLQSFIHSHCLLTHALSPSISILFTYSFIYFIDTFICLLTLH